MFNLIRKTKAKEELFQYNNYQEALIQSIKLARECLIDEQHIHDSVFLEVEEEGEVVEKIDVTELQDSFLSVQNNTDEVYKEGFYGIASGAFYNAEALRNGENSEYIEDHVIYVEDNDVIDLGTDWKYYVAFMAKRFGSYDIDINEVLKQV